MEGAGLCGDGGAEYGLGGWPEVGARRAGELGERGNLARGLLLPWGGISAGDEHMHLQRFLSWVQLSPCQGRGGLVRVIMSVVSEVWSTRVPQASGRIAGATKETAGEGCVSSDVCEECVKVLGLRVLLAATCNLDTWVVLLKSYPELRASLVQCLSWRVMGAAVDGGSGDIGGGMGGAARRRRWSAEELWGVTGWDAGLRGGWDDDMWIRDVQSVLAVAVLTRGTFLASMESEEGHGESNEPSIELEGNATAFWRHLRSLTQAPPHCMPSASEKGTEGEHGAGAEGASPGMPVSIEDVLGADVGGICSSARRFLLLSVADPVFSSRRKADTDDGERNTVGDGGRGTGGGIEEGEGLGGGSDEAGLLMWMLALQMERGGASRGGGSLGQGTGGGGLRASLAGREAEFRKALADVSFWQGGGGGGCWCVDWWAGVVVVVCGANSMDAEGICSRISGLAARQRQSAGGGCLGREREVGALVYLVDVLAAEEMPQMRNMMKMCGRPISSVARVWLRQLFLTAAPFSQVLKILCIAREYGPTYLVYICLCLLRHGHGAVRAQTVTGEAGPGVSGKGEGDGVRGGVNVVKGGFDISAELAYLHGMEAKYGSLCRHCLCFD